MTPTTPQRRRLIILGSTGSIGVNTLKVVEHLNAIEAGGSRLGSGVGKSDLSTPQRTSESLAPNPQPPAPIQVVGLAAGHNVKVLIEQARKFTVPAVAIADASAAEQVRAALPGVRVHAGQEAALRLVEESDATDLSAAIVGSAGLAATLAGVRKGLRVGLANKETLVAAGALVTPLVRQYGATLIPVDSEHSAIFQCLQSGSGFRVSGFAERAPSSTICDTRHPTPETRAIKRIVLTASGGPFRAVPKEKMQAATVEEALNHPTWKMGPKITIDSATMMNKALEIIEAHWLFDLPPDKIQVIIHPQSVVHSFVEFTDHSILAQLGPPDMKTPIQYALTYPARIEGCSAAMDWSKLSKLEFEPPDLDKFAALRLAYDVIEAGGTAGAVFNAANEAAVAAFLERKIRFGRIVELVAEALSALAPRTAEDLATILEADRLARQVVDRLIGRSA